MKASNLYSSIQKSSRGGVKTFLLLLSSLLIFSFTACGNVLNSNKKPELEWPDTLKQQDKTLVAALSTATFTESVDSMQTILNILDKYKDDLIVKQSINILSKIRAALACDDVTSLTNAINGEDVVKLTKLPESAKEEKQERTITLNNTNSALFPTQYNAAVTAKETYDNYKNGEYASAWDVYEDAWDVYESAYNTYSAAYGNEEEPADNTYLKAYNTYKNSLSALPRAEYNKLVNFAKDVVEDFKKNYVFDQTYSEEQVRGLINAAKDEANEQKASRDAALETYNTAKDEFVNGAENDFRTVQNTLDGKEAIFESKQSNLAEKYNDAVAAKQAYDNAAQGVKNLTVGDNVENMDFTGATYVQLSIPSSAESVDVFAFIETWQALKNKIGDNSNVTLVENYNGKSFNIDFAAKEAAGKSNTDLLNEYYTSYVEEKLTSEDEGKIVETELMPGLSIVTFMDFWHNGNPEVLNALKVLRETKVQMPQNYSLGGNELNNSTYKSGIIGNVTLENLDSNTNIFGTVYGKESFSSVYDLFVKNQDASELPNMNVEFSLVELDRSNAESWNLYGQNIDTLVKKYYDNNKGNKLTLNFAESFRFDARDYLNGDSMYEGNTYKNNAYPLDINAALVMNPSTIRNVQIVKGSGVQRTSEKNELMLLENVVVSVSMSGITTSAKGVVDFMDEAPTKVSGSYSFITFKNVSNTVNVGGMGYVDATALSQAQANYIVGPNNGSYAMKKLARTSGVILPGAVVPGGIFESIDGFGITKQQVEQNTNDELSDPLEVSKVLPRDIKQSKMDLMRNILEANQSTLLSFSDLPTHCHSRA